MKITKQQFKNALKVLNAYDEQEFKIEPLIENSNATDKVTEGKNPLSSKGDMLRYLDKMAGEYVVDSQNSLIRSTHMNKLNGKKVNQDVINAVVVDFVNFVGSYQGLDYCMYTKDLK